MPSLYGRVEDKLYALRCWREIANDPAGLAAKFLCLKRIPSSRGYPESVDMRTPQEYVLMPQTEIFRELGRPREPYLQTPLKYEGKAGEINVAVHAYNFHFVVVACAFFEVTAELRSTVPLS